MQCSFFCCCGKATGLTWPCLIVGALFALHPVNVESVAWAAERKNVLSMLFFLLALHAYDRYARTGGPYLYLSVNIFFILGLMAKPQIVTLPFVLLLWDYWPLQRIGATVQRGGGLPAPSTQRSFRLSSLGKAAPLHSCRCGFGRDHAGAARRERGTDGYGSLAVGAAGECLCLLRALYRKVVVAVPPRCHVSPSREFAARLASGGSGVAASSNSPPWCCAGATGAICRLAGSGFWGL